MDKIFQKFCDHFPPYKMNNKIKKKFFYIIFSIFKKLIKGPFSLNFGSINFYAYPENTDYTRFLLTRVELPDKIERNIIIKNLNHNKNIFIDCGANAGFYSLDIWSKVNNCKIYAFEPSIKERYFLKENIKLNNAFDIEVIDLALGDGEKKVIFNDLRGYGRNSSGCGFITISKAISKNNYEVQMTTLDNFFEEKNIKNSKIFIKIDLEGYDLKTLLGAKKLILNNNCDIIFEFSRMVMEQKDYNKNIFDIFIKKNYKIFDIFGNIVTISDLENKIAKLDISKNTCGNFILSNNKNLIF